MSDRQLSMLATGSTDTIRNIRRGANPRTDTLEAICDVLGLELQIGSRRGGDAPVTDIRAVAPAVVEGPASTGDGAAIVAAIREEVAGAVRAGTEVLRAEISRLKPALDDLQDAGALAVIGEGFGESQGSRHVEVVQFEAAAGGGAEAMEERIIGTLAFCRQWMDRHALTPMHCAVIDVRGDSMEPTLWDGASILLDRARSEWRPGCIYVIRTSDGVVVKRAGEDEAGNWQFLSDHPAWEPTPYPDDAEIIGQVVWTARTLIDTALIDQRWFGDAGNANRIDAECLQLAMEAVDEGLVKTGRVMGAEDRALLIVKVYQYIKSEPHGAAQDRAVRLIQEQAA